MVGEQLITLSEQALMEQIRAVAVLTVHKVVHRVEFSKIRQDEGESIAHFVSRLKAKASLCAFTVVAEAPGDVSYEDNMVEGQMMSGLYSDEHRARVLTEADKLPTFKDKYNALVTMHTADMSTSQLTSTASFSTQRKSDYKNQSRQEEPQRTKACKTCGRDFTSRVFVRRLNKYKTFEVCKDCWVKSQKCTLCDSAGHLRNSCPNRGDSANTTKTGMMVAEEVKPTQAMAGFTFAANQQLTPVNPSERGLHEGDKQFAAAIQQSQRNKPLPNLEWQHGRFVRQSPRRQPHIRVKVTVMHASHSSFGLDLGEATRNSVKNDVPVMALADTGAQSCSSGPDLLRALN